MLRPTLLLAACTWMAATVHAQSASIKKIATLEWPCYGNDAGGIRYAPNQQINTDNVNQLKVAWTFRTGELETYQGTELARSAAFEATPIMIAGTLYFTTPTCRVFAIDAATGKEKWRFDPGIDKKGRYTEVTSRGVSAWPTNSRERHAAIKRIFVPVIGGKLIALDATTGKLIPTFGKDGVIDLNEGMGGPVSVTSPPAITGNTIIIGSTMGDNQRFDYPKGTVKAFDAITGALKWKWDPMPSDSTDKAFSTWKGSKVNMTGGANAWAPISVDHQRDLIFVPTSCPSPDYYGGERIGDNRYANSIVALHASTGKVVWHFQVVHHDIWDYDIAAQPLLFDIEKQGKKIPAVAVGTKMGHIFVFNRETGETLFPIEERPVPQSTLPGEQTSPTQPFPVLPAPVGLQKVTEKDAFGFTPEGKEKARKILAQHRHEGIFTPPSIEGSIITPGNAGGIHWGGMCYDPQQGLLITNINNLAAIITMYPRENWVEEKDSKGIRAETGRQTGTPYIMKRDYLFGLEKIGPEPEWLAMQFQPPWGTLLAIDLHTGKKKWEVPLGSMYDPKNFPGADQWGSINFGGAIATEGNLTFVAATMDGHFRAFNSQTGKELWKYLLPAGGQATPMSYTVNGKQYVLIAAGGHGKFGSKLGDYVVAFSLP